ncbi:hypothetical protein FALCPG4_018406 [Fusarium falciforme]
MSTFRLNALLDPSDDDLSKLLDNASPEPEKRHCFFYWYEKWVGRKFLARALPIEPKQLIDAVAATNFLVQRDAGKISSLMHKFIHMFLLLGEGEFDGQATGFAFIAAQHFLWPNAQKPDWLVAEPSLLAINLNEQPETSQSHPTTAHFATNNKGHPRPNFDCRHFDHEHSRPDYGIIIRNFSFVQLGALRYFEGDWNNIRDKDVKSILAKGRAGHLNDGKDNDGSPMHIAKIADNIANINCDPKNKLNFGVCVDHPCKIMRAKRCVPPGGEEELLVADPRVEKLDR